MLRVPIMRLLVGSHEQAGSLSMAKSVCMARIRARRVSNRPRQPVLVLAAPEGVPKLEATIELAQQLNGEIIAASSTQVRSGQLGVNQCQ